MNYNPKLSMIIDGNEFNYKFFETLECIAKTYSQRQAKRLEISHSVLNRRIKEAEEKFDSVLVETTGAGSGLTEKGYEILDKYETYMKRLEERKKPVICGGHISTGLMEILSQEYDLNVTILQTDDLSALELADKDMVDILTLDDPVTAFIYDLDFIPIAYDYLVLVGEEFITDIAELNRKNFLEIPNSSQRLAWNTLDNIGIDYDIVKLVKSPYNAINAIKKDKNLFTFLNKSLTDGSDILKDETTHLISLVLLNKDNKGLSNFVDFVIGDGQKIIEMNGFIRI